MVFCSKFLDIGLLLGTNAGSRQILPVAVCTKLYVDNIEMDLLVLSAISNAWRIYETILKMGSILRKNIDKLFLTLY
jgi:hypothetical protein